MWLFQLTSAEYACVPATNISETEHVQMRKTHAHIAYSQYFVLLLFKICIFTLIRDICSMNDKMPEWKTRVALISTFHHLKKTVFLNIWKMFPVMPTVLITKEIGIKMVG